MFLGIAEEQLNYLGGGWSTSRAHEHLHGLDEEASQGKGLAVLSEGGQGEGLVEREGNLLIGL